MKFGLIKIFCISVFAIIVMLVLLLCFSSVKYDYIVSEPHLPPSVKYLLGTDYLGRDLFIRICYAILNTLFVVGCSVSSSLFFGLIYGAYAGYKGGMVEKAMIIFLNILESVPSFLLIIFFLVLFNNFISEKSSILGVLATLTFVSWIYMSRIIVNETKKIMGADYIQYAIFKNAHFWHIFTFHLLPNLKNTIITVVIQKIPSFIFIESFLSFVGIGIQPPIPSLGKMISDGVKVFRIYPHELFAPVFAIVFIVFVFNVIGEMVIFSRKEYV